MSLAPDPTRTPRAQSAAAIGRLPTACRSPSSTGWVAGADVDGVLGDLEHPRLQGVAVRREAHRAELDPPAVVRRPGARRGRAGADLPVDLRRGRDQSTTASSTEIFGARLTPSAGCSRASTEPSSMPSSVRTSSSAPPIGEPRSRSPAVSVGTHGLGDQPEHRPGVERGDDAERGRPGHLVAGPQRVLHRGRAAPGREQREVQVDPAVGRDVESALRQHRAVGDHRAAVRGQLGQRGLEVRVARVAPA